MKSFPDQPDTHGEVTDALRAVLDAAPSPVIGVRADGSLDYVNDRALALFGYTAEQLVGQPVWILVPERPEVTVGERLRQMLELARHASRVEDDVWLRRADGGLFQADVTLIPLDTPDGVRVITTIRDLTQRKQEDSRMRDLSRAYLSLVEMNQAIVRAPDAPTLFAETCRIAVEQGGNLGAWVAQPDADGTVHCVAVAGELNEFIEQLEVSLDPDVPEGRGPTAQALREGRAVFSTEYYAERRPDVRERVALSYGIRSSATLPLRCAGRTVAVFALYTDRRDPFDSQMRGLLESMSENVSFALEGFHRAAELRRVALQRRELSRRLVVAQEDERSRIAADVHDDSVQALAAADLRLGLLRRQLLEQAPHLAPMLDQVQHTLAGVTSGLRDLLFDLESADAATPLMDHLREAASHLFEDGRIAWTLELEPTDGWNGVSRLSQTHRGQALRIVKEALFNVRKHAVATQVRIVVAPGDAGVEFSVTDDGAGFDPETVGTSPGHRGLANMRDRAAVSGGWCTIERGEAGMNVRFWMPYLET